MLNFVEFVLLLVLGISIAILAFLATGFTHTKKGYISVIERCHKFYKFEENSWSYYLPLVFSRRFMYPIKEGKCKLKDSTIIVYEVSDMKLLYKHKIKIDKLIKKSNNLDADFKKYNIRLLRIE